MPTPQPCTDEEIARLVHDFYDSARADAMLGPVFAAHVRDWDAHLAKMVDFWSSALRGTARYRGTPLPAHVALPELSSELFGRWLCLFRHSTRVIANAQARARANELAVRIAQSLWYAWQLARDPAAAPVRLLLQS